ncbi:phytoene desaturase family protein [Pseudonocardia parietis]|uniref:Glycine/D-amino acid oxidase-like deaminating enzyme n=1 Tax=Pseudonocardia parietis TaxID=570936 RepID=A0ABS4VTM1_9PSEU|nr:FAD-dependent oxidoreductase [Pseudonocardia parietis]MBP2367267.1 glycine/D-amino acid oxidase-like deaminating enzyme [Pseudonocardia parietis]
MRYDVVVVGAGVAGLVTALTLVEQGKRVALVEKHGYLGGRAMEHRYRGHQIGLGSHLVEDPGDSLTRVCELVGITVTHSDRSDSMPFWDRDRWRPIQELYSGSAKQGLKRCIQALTETDYADLDKLDHLPLREWMAQYTSDEGVYTVWEAISILEQITDKWYDHSASENLYVRKMHYERKRTAGYSFWPMGGWEKLWKEMAAAFTARGGELLLSTTVRRVLVDDGAVTGVELRGAAGAPGDVLEADAVVVNAPVWNVPNLFEDGVLPHNLLQRIRMLAGNRNRACWIGYWIAAKEPVIAMSEREMASFQATPRTGLGGFTLNFTGYDPDVSPPGEYLTCVGAAFDATQHYGDKAWLDRKFHEFWLDIEDMMPQAKGALWTKKHLVTTYGVINKPGLVGAVRPDTRVREIDGLFLTGDTVRSRGIGIDKAARTGITAAEAVLGDRLPFFADTVRY